MNGARRVGCAPRRLGYPGPWRQQAILGRGRWDAQALRDIVRDYALETLADKDAVLVIDETGFLKQGKVSCGCAPVYWLGGQYDQLPNRRVHVLCVASRPCLHRPGALSAAGMDGRSQTHDGGAWPGDVSFATKPQIARRMIARAIAAKVPFSFVAADSVYGTGELETALRKSGKGHGWRSRQSSVPFLGQEADGSRKRGEDCENLPKSAWRRLSAGDGTKGARRMTGPILNWPI